VVPGILDGACGCRSPDAEEGLPGAVPMRAGAGYIQSKDKKAGDRAIRLAEVTRHR